MTGETGQLLVRSGRSRFYLQCLPASDFPDLTAGEFAHRFTLPAAELKRLIDKTQFAISTEETRYYLNGIYFHTVESGGTTVLRAVATDGHRLARVETPAPQGAAGMPGVIVPRKAVNEVLKLLEDLDPGRRDRDLDRQGALPFRRRRADHQADRRHLPRLRPRHPGHNDKRLTVEKEAFAKAVDRVSTISSERGRAIKLAIADDKMTLSVNNPDSGSASEEIEVDYDSAPIEIGFNARYLLDIADQLAGDTALIKLSDPGSPTIIQDRDGSPALYVLMPLRV